MPFCISSPGPARNPEKLLTTPILTTVCAATGGGTQAASAAKTGKNLQFICFEAIGFFRVSLDRNVPTDIKSGPTPICLSHRDKRGLSNRLRRNRPCTCPPGPPSLSASQRPAPVAAQTDE